MEVVYGERFSPD